MIKLEWNHNQQSNTHTASYRVGRVVEFDVCCSKPEHRNVCELQITMFAADMDMSGLSERLGKTWLATRYIDSAHELHSYLGECIIYQGVQASIRDCKVMTELWISQMLEILNVKPNH